MGSFSKRLTGSVVLSLLLVALVVASTPGEWLTFPLRASLRARDLQWALGEHGHTVSVAKLLVALVVGGMVLGFVSRPSAVISVSAALVLVLSVPVTTSAFRVSLLETYVRESAERLTFTAYETQQFVPNVSPEPAFTPVVQFEDAGEQLGIGFVMLGWGWYIAMGSVSALLIVVFRRWQFSRRSWATGATVLAFSAVAMGPSARLLLKSQFAQNRGDRMLVAGQGTSAVGAYERAYSENPALGCSQPFLKKASMALKISSGGRHPLGSLSQDLDLPSRRSEEGIDELYDAARKRLLDAVFMRAAPRGLEVPLQRAAANLLSELWRSEGIARANERRYSEALGAHLRARAEPESISAFYLAHAYLVLGVPGPAIEAFSRLQQQVANRSIRADLLCSLGDAYTVEGDLAKARDAYRSCRDLDKIENYRAFKALTGS